MSYDGNVLLIATLAVAAMTACFLFGKKVESNGKKVDSNDILGSVLSKTAPNAASDELGGSVLTCERKLDGVKLIITKDPKLADYIFNGRFQKNYTRRPANQEGLKMLGMCHQGLIWNNDLSTWKKVRLCFQLSLNDLNMEKAVNVIKQSTASLISANVDQEGFVDMMSICRRLTFRATLSTFFGIDAADFSAMGVEELEYIDSIVNYFKAWEYFLLRPKHYWESALEKKHHSAVKELQGHVRRMLESISDRPTSNSTAGPLFIDQLCNVCRDIKCDHQDDFLVQGALEMLIAGTDTSSVTAYYALLGLASDQGLQLAVRQDVIAAGHSSSKSKLMRSVIDETLRFKPVGPVVLREAVEDDPNFPGFSVEGGTAILIHLADMNLCENNWTDPRSFCPRRFMHNDQDIHHVSKKFFPFGNGPKGCIGMHLGRREVTAILEAVLMNYTMDITSGDPTLGSLDTHWDIANQPENPTLIKLVEV